MNQLGPIKKYKLQSFSRETIPQDCNINVLFSKDAITLQVVFELTAKLNDLIIPVFDLSRAKRKDRLWEHTCFEIFLGEDGRSNYREFNLSPSGEWNVYAFSDYREGMKQESSFDILPFEVKIFSEQELSLSIAFDLDTIPALSDLKVGISSVLERKDGVKSYWAFSHSGEVPDFHAREGWIQV